MKIIGKFLKYKKIIKKNQIDKESVFYILRNIIKIKFGEIGVLNIKFDFYDKGVIFLKINNSNWANEIWLNKQLIINEINKKIGENEIIDIRLK
jgi:hypothetical protein